MGLLYSRKKYKELEAENELLKNQIKNNDESLSLYNKEIENNKELNQKILEYLEELKTLQQKCEKYEKYYNPDGEPSEEIQEKVARDLEVIRLKDELFKERQLNSVLNISSGIYKAVSTHLLTSPLYQSTYYYR